MATSMYSEIMRLKPKAYYPLSEASGSTAHDKSGNGFDATIGGGVTLGQKGALKADTSPSMLWTTAGGGYIQCPSGLKTDGWSAFTASLWVNRLNQSDFVYILLNDLNPAAHNVGWLINLDNTGDGATGYFKVGNGTTAKTLGWGSVPLTTSTWYHIVCTYDGSNLRVYQNGVLVAGPSGLAGTIGTATMNTLIGADDVFGDGGSNLYLAQVSIFNAVLTANQIAWLYNVGLGAGAWQGNHRSFGRVV